MAAAIDEQTTSAARSAREQREAVERQTELLADVAERQAEAQEQAAFAAERAAEELQDTLNEASRQQRANIANSWILQSRTHVKRAEELFRSELFDEALAHVRRAVELDQGNLRAHCLAARVHMALGHTSEAYKSCTIQLRLLRTARFASPRWFKYALDRLPPGSDFETELAHLPSTMKLQGAYDDWRSFIRTLFDRGFDNAALQLWDDVFARSQSIHEIADGLRLGSKSAPTQLTQLFASATAANARADHLTGFNAISADKWLRPDDVEQVRTALKRAYVGWAIAAPSPPVVTAPNFYMIFCIGVLVLFIMNLAGASVMALSVGAAIFGVFQLLSCFACWARYGNAQSELDDQYEKFVGDEQNRWSAVLAPDSVRDIVAKPTLEASRLAVAPGLVMAGIMLILVPLWFSMTKANEFENPPLWGARPTPEPRGQNAVPDRSEDRRPVAPRVASSKPIRNGRTATIQVRQPPVSEGPPEIRAQDQRSLAPVRVGTRGVRTPEKTRHVEPVYPEDARAARVLGTVIVELLLDPTGNVASARVLRGIPMLNDAALAAVKEWKFAPTTVDGVAVPVLMTTVVQFRGEDD